VVVRKGMMAETKGNITEEHFDYVVTAWNRRSNRNPISKLQGLAREIYETGDSVKCLPLNMDNTIYWQQK
jgi:hypothetical protein